MALAAPPTEDVGRYQTFMVFFSMNHSRDWCEQTLTKLVVVTPVIAGVDNASTATHVVPSYSCGLSAPLTMYRKLPPLVPKLTCCHLSEVWPLTTAAPTAPALLAS